MPGTPSSGNRGERRGHRTRLRHTLTKDAALALRLLAWQRHGRPATDKEENALLSALVLEEAERARAAAALNPPLTAEEYAAWERQIADEE
jgi:hypothetical protein